MDRHEFQYLDLHVECHQSFGEQTAIPIANPIVRKVELVLESVIFSDESKWTNPEKEKFAPLPSPVALSLQGDLRKQFFREIGRPNVYMLRHYEGLWQCECGAWNIAIDDQCYFCHLSMKKQKDMCNEEVLKPLLQKHQGMERIEKERQLQEKRKHDEQLEKDRLALKEALRLEQIQVAQKRKRRNVLILIAAFICIATLVVTKIIIPAQYYKKAEQLLARGKYIEAVTQFEAAGLYEDAQTRKLGVYYAQAEALLAAKNYKGASQAFANAGEYEDASERAYELYYVQAEALLEANDYDGARKSFINAGEYKDASERVHKLYYAQAEALLEVENYAAASQTFDKASGYKDALKRAWAIRYTYLCTGNISANSHTVGLKSDGTVVAVGLNVYGQTDVDSLHISTSYTFR